MTQQTSPFLEGKYGWALGESNWNLGMDENLLKFSYMFDKNIDGIVSSLPAVVNGTAYFNTTDNRIYFAVSGSYTSTPVPQWFVITLRTTGEMYQFNGTSLDLYELVSTQTTYLANGTGAEKQSVQSVLRKDILATDYMTDAERADALTGIPTLDFSPAFTDFFAAVLAYGGRGRIPKGTYKLDTNVLGNWTQVIEYDEGVAFTGAGILFAIQQVINKQIATREVRRGTAEVSSQTVGKYDIITSEGSSPCYGTRQDYFHTGTLTSGFSLGQGNIAVFSNIAGGQGMAGWEVSTSPTLAAGGTYGVVVKEMNIMNRGPDQGYAKFRGATTRWTGGLQIVPESDDLAGGTGNICRNTLFGFCTAHSGNLNDLGLNVKTYNGLLIEKDSIGPSGRGVLAVGDTSGVVGQLPNYGLEIDQRWAQGINTTGATFTGNVAVNMGDNQTITWSTTGPTVTGSNASGLLRLASSGSGNILLAPGGAGSGAMQLVPIASAVNLFSVNGAAAGGNPQLVVAGADTDINFIVAAKGAGRFQVNIGDIAVNTAGKGLRVKEGSNAKQGVATLVAGSVVVANTSVTATSRIFLTSQQDGGTPGFLRVSARTVGTSFTITSGSGTDTSVVAYQIYEPA